MEPGDYAIDAVLNDGRATRIRSIRPDDKQRLSEAFRRLTRESVYSRFLGSKLKLSEKDLVYLTEIDFIHHVALVATLKQNQDEYITGVGRYVEVASPGPSRAADVAFIVADDHQGLGLGTLLLHHLIQIARACGISEFTADVLAENSAMLKVFERCGFPLERTMESGLVHLSFPLKM